ncbi:unnamed protein product [Clonostachys rhizophaga]|uniref:Uncharacterized protein n=1 Tax=Clonostachys rhizophaga TaxID=160324 RepID=A0A9N9V853_9HYPO|nr:unnamed protein product [Clonostachys rhizophaga]
MSLSIPHQAPADSTICYNNDISSGGQTRGISIHPKNVLNHTHSSESVSNIRSEKNQSTSDATSWRPFWLGHIRLAGFGLWFLCCTIALPIMLHYSELNKGLLVTREDLAYLWRFGPTAIFTVVAVLWSRVELQALIYMPWASLSSKQPISPKEYQLDYVSMIVPTVLVQSLRRRHYFVFLVTLLSVILKIQTVLSAALFFLGDEKEIRPVQLKVLDIFNTTSGRASNVSSGAYYSALAIRDTDMEIPFGVGADCAYQTFKRSDHDGHARGTVDEPLEAIVDGVFMDIKCLKLESWSATRKPTGLPSHFIDEGQNLTGLFHYNFTIDLQFENCDQSITVKDDEQAWATSDVHYSTGDGTSTDWHSSLDSNGIYSWWFPNDLETPLCSSLPQQHPQTLYYAMHYRASSSNSSEPEIDTMAGVICSPTAWVSKVQVVDDGVSPNVTALPNQTNVTADFNAWTLLGNSISSLDNGWVPDYMSNKRDDQYIGDGPVGADLFFKTRKKVDFTMDPNMLHSNVLSQSIADLIKALGPLLAHYQLRQSEESIIDAKATQVLHKVKIGQAICISMASLFGLSLCIGLWALLKSKKTFKGWYRNPSTVLGSMIFLNDKFNFGLSSRNQENYKEGWVDCKGSPLAFKLWFRLVFTSYVLALIVGLAVSLKISQTSDGLVTITEESDLFVWWKIVPAFSMLLVALYTGFSSFSVREISNHADLSSRPCRMEELDTSILDMVGLRALYHSVRLEKYSVALLQSLTILCTFLTALSAPLFTPELVPANQIVSLPEETWFGARALKNDTDEYTQNRKTVATMFYTPNNTNQTYPPFTYGELLFPRLAANLSDEDWVSGKDVKVVTPTAKLVSACAAIPDDEYTLNYTSSKHHQFRYYGVKIIQDSVCPNGTFYKSSEETLFSEEAVSDGVAYFAHSLGIQGYDLVNNFYCKTNASAESLRNTPWKTQSFIWGKFSPEKNEVKHVSVWACNYTWGQINMDVKLTRNNGNIYVDHQTPPKQADSGVQPWSPPFPVIDTVANDVVAFPSNDYLKQKGSDLRTYGLDAMFVNMVPPFGSLDIEAFGDPSRDHEILELLRSNIGLINAQVSNLENRLDIDEESIITPFNHGEAHLINATIVDNRRQRLIQNFAITITMVVVLCLVFAVHAWGLISLWLKRYVGERAWLLDLEFKGLVPEGFNSVAMMDGLMRGSNCFDHLPDDAHLQSPSELYENSAGVRFRIGWFQRAERSEEEFALGVLGDEMYRFLEPKADVHNRKYSSE